MLEKFENLVTNIEENENELNQLISKINEIEKTRLDEVVKIAKKGLIYQRIIRQKESHNCNGNCYHPDKNEYFDLKGVRLVEIDNGSESKDGEGYEIDAEELWLLDDGTFLETCRVGYQSFWQDDWWSWVRTSLRK